MKSNFYLKPWGTKTIGRFLALFLALTMLFGLGACGKPKYEGAKEIEPAIESIIEPVIVEREAESQVLQTANEATALALKYYIYVRLKTEELIAADFESQPAGTFESMMDELVSMWEIADVLVSVADEIADHTIFFLEAESARQMASGTFSQPQAVTLAAVSPSFSTLALASNNEKVIDRETWAENLTKMFDELRGAQRYKQLAEQLGTDTKTAVEQMALAQKIIKNIADLEEAQAEISAYTRSINILEGYKTGSKVGLFVGATVATGGGSLASLAGSSMSLGTAGAVVVSGVDCIVDVGKTASAIILGEDHQVAVDFKVASDIISPVSSVVSLVTLDPANTVSQIAYVGESLKEWFYPGAITSVFIDYTKEGNRRILSQIVQPAQKNYSDNIKILEKYNIIPPKEKGVSLSQLIMSNLVDAQSLIARMEELLIQHVSLIEAYENQSSPPQETSLSGSWGGTAVLVGGDEVEDIEVEQSISFTMVFNGDNEGTAYLEGGSVGISVSNDGSQVSFSASQSANIYGIVLTSNASFNGTVTAEGVMVGTMIFTIAGQDGSATCYYDWSAYK